MQQYTVKEKNEIINTFSKVMGFSVQKSTEWAGFIPASANVSDCSQNELILVRRSC